HSPQSVRSDPESRSNLGRFHGEIAEAGATSGAIFAEVRGRMQEPRGETRGSLRPSWRSFQYKLSKRIYGIQLGKRKLETRSLRYGHNVRYG
nr:hypothetical protein [Tanacetum cinerariifolium]